jgi:hypothetical protein
MYHNQMRYIKQLYIRNRQNFETLILLHQNFYPECKTLHISTPCADKK